MVVAAPSDNGTVVDRARAYSRDEDSHRVTVTDYDFAAYLLSRGVPLVDAVRVSDHVHTFTFLDRPEGADRVGRVAGLAIEFANSESARFADALRRLKKITYSRRQLR